MPDSDMMIDAAPASGIPLDQTITDRMVIDDALATLAPDFRAPVVLRDVLGLDYAEIAEVLEIPAGTVRSRIARGRKALAEQVGWNQMPSGDVETKAHD